MSDFTTISLQFNKGTDASTDWTGTALNSGGTSGANELRFAPTGGGQTTTTASASWPLATKPGSGTAVFQELWCFSADAVGVKCTTYDGANTNARVLRFNFDALGSMASPPQLSCFDSTSHTTPSPGTQPSLINGSSNTSNKSAVKINVYGRGANSSGSTQDTPSAGSVGSAPTATSGTTGSVSSPTSPAWLTNWQDAQGWLDYWTDAVTPQALFAFQLYWTTALFYASDISASTYTFTYTLQYTYS
jgi:hypothetical protein